MTFRPGARRIWRLFFVVTLTLVGVLGLTRTAFAQAQITLPTAASLPRLDKNGKTVTKRPSGLNPEGVSYQDCIDDQQIQFALQMTGFQVGGSVQAWASIGQDCTQSTARGGGVQTCWRVYDSDIPLSANPIINVPVRKIMSGAPPNYPYKADASDAVCGTVDLSNVKVDFLYFAPGNSATGSVAATATITVDTVGPLPPSGLRTKPGNTRISVYWDQISGGTEDDSGASTGGGGVTDILGVRVYCDVAQATTTTSGASCSDASTDVDAEAGTDSTQTCVDGGATTSTTSACSSPNFVSADGAPIIPTSEFDKSYLCGELNGTGGTSVTATGVGGKPLTNDTSYALALAGTDRFGNVGRLSSVRCESPEVTTDFWDAYRNDGGHAGDGCTTSGDAPLGSVATLSIAVAVSLSSIFRARRNTRKPAKESRR